jgi:hypothetical protein
MASGMVAQSPAQQRELMRSWLVALLGAEGVEIALPEPADWSRWDAGHAAVVAMTQRGHDPIAAPSGGTVPACPFCDSAAVELVSPWGGQIITAQWRCRALPVVLRGDPGAFDDAPAPKPPVSG